MAAMLADISPIRDPEMNWWRTLLSLIIGDNGTGTYYFVMLHEGGTLQDVPARIRRQHPTLRLSSYVLPHGEMDLEQLKRATRQLNNEGNHMKIVCFPIKSDTVDFYVYSYWKC